MCLEADGGGDDGGQLGGLRAAAAGANGKERYMGLELVR